MSGVKSKVDNLKSLYNEGLFILLICVIKKKLRSSFSAIDLDYLAVGVNHRLQVAGYRLQVTGHRLQVQVTGQQITDRKKTYEIVM